MGWLMGLMMGLAAAQPASLRMADGRLWTVENLATPTKGSSCYADDPANCAQYGRLYTWSAARRACKALGDGWRLPTFRDWEKLALSYGTDDPSDGNQTAYAALIEVGPSEFGARLGGGIVAGRHEGLGETGHYWAKTKTGAVVTPHSSTRPFAWISVFDTRDERFYHSFFLRDSRYSVRCVRKS